MRRSLLLALLAAACGDGSSPAATADAGPDLYPATCENLNPRLCLLPWPSSFYLVDDATTATGRRIEIPLAAMPVSSAGEPVDPTQLRRFDGFSPATAVVTAYDGDIDPANLADERHIADSLAAESPTVIIDAATGARVAHFAEIDTWPDMEPARRPLYLRPAARLGEGRRYLVAIRNLRHPGGAPIDPSPYFRALRDGTPLPGAADLEKRRPHFEEIFRALAAAGVERGALLEAWDFATASGENLWGETVAMRDAALLAMAADSAPRCAVTTVDEEPTDTIWRRVHGTVRVPLFLESGDPLPPESARVHRGSDGRPLQNGWWDLPFTVNVPRRVRDAVAAGGPPARLVDYGHGLFGSRAEGDSGWMQHHLDATGMVSVAIDWWGMATEDVPRVVLTMKDFSSFIAMGERMQQGLINHVALHRAFRTGCAALPELQVNGNPLIDRDEIYYYGNSQGGIFGLSVAALAVDVTHLVSGVGGMTYSVMIPRSSNWQFYGSFMQAGYHDPLTRALLMTLAQSIWDLGDASTYAPHIVSDPLPCAREVCPSGLTPPHQLLMQIGRDDAQVPNVCAELAARTAGIGYYQRAPLAPWGLTPLDAARGAPLAPSALVIFDIPDTRMLPLGTRDPGAPTPAHEGVRRTAAAISQIDAFQHEDGVVIQTCDGACDPD